MKRSQQGFTLMELMVVIVIVAILAAVAVPLYINYVKDAQRTEAKGAIGAVITAEQAYFQKNQGNSYGTIAQLTSSGLLDLTEVAGKWTITDEGTPDITGFSVKATPVSGDTSIVVTYDYKRDGSGTGFNR